MYSILCFVSEHCIYTYMLIFICMLFNTLAIYIHSVYTRLVTVMLLNYGIRVSEVCGQGIFLHFLLSYTT